MALPREWPLYKDKVRILVPGLCAPTILSQAGLLPLEHDLNDSFFFFANTSLRSCFLFLFFFFLINLFYLFIFGSSLLRSGFSLVAASGGYSSLQCAGFSLAVASLVAEHGL